MSADIIRWACLTIHVWIPTESQPGPNCSRHCLVKVTTCKFTKRTHIYSIFVQRASRSPHHVHTTFAFQKRLKNTQICLQIATFDSRQHKSGPNTETHKHTCFPKTGLQKHRKTTSKTCVFFCVLINFALHLPTHFLEIGLVPGNIFKWTANISTKACWWSYTKMATSTYQLGFGYFWISHLYSSDKTSKRNNVFFLSQLVVCFFLFCTELRSRVFA